MFGPCSKEENPGTVITNICYTRDVAPLNTVHFISKVTKIQLKKLRFEDARIFLGPDVLLITNILIKLYYLSVNLFFGMNN